MGTGVISRKSAVGGCDIDQSPSSSAEVKNEWSHTSIPPYITSWRG